MKMQVLVLLTAIPQILSIYFRDRSTAYHILGRHSLFMGSGFCGYLQSTIDCVWQYRCYPEISNFQETPFIDIIGRFVYSGFKKFVTPVFNILISFFQTFSKYGL